MPTKTTRTLSAGLVGAALLTGVGLLQPAIAYPPGTGLAVSGRATSTQPTRLTVTVSQAKPGCSVSVTAKAGSATASGQTKTNANGSATFTLNLGNVKAARAQVSAMTVGSCSYKEKASTTVNIKQKVTVTAPAKVQSGEAFPVSGQGFAPGAKVTFTAQGNGKTYKRTAVANSQGKASASFVVYARTTWTLTGASAGTSASTTFKVV